jgi:hypothetical protein
MTPDRKDVEVARAWVRQAGEEDIAERIAGLEAVLVDIIEKCPETLAADLAANGLEWSRSSDIGEPVPMPYEYRVVRRKPATFLRLACWRRRGPLRGRAPSDRSATTTSPVPMPTRFCSGTCASRTVTARISSRQGMMI